MQIMWKMEMNEIQKKCHRQGLNTGQQGHNAQAKQLKIREITRKESNQGLESHRRFRKWKSIGKSKHHMRWDRTEVRKVASAFEAKRSVWIWKRKWNGK